MNPHGRETGVYSSSLLPRSAWPWSLHYDQNRHFLFSALAHSQNKPWTSETQRCSRRLENWDFFSPVCCGEVVCQQQSLLTGNSICKWRRLTWRRQMDSRAAGLSCSLMHVRAGQGRVSCAGGQRGDDSFYVRVS